MFVADDPYSTARAWIGPEPIDVAASPEELAERGIEQAVADRADAALARAAAATGAELRFVPDGEQPPRSGVGARCVIRCRKPELRAVAGSGKAEPSAGRNAALSVGSGDGSKPDPEEA